MHTDEVLWKTLRIVVLDVVVESLPGGVKPETILLDRAYNARSTRMGKQPSISPDALPTEDRQIPSVRTTQPLSARQLRYLALGRIIADRSKLRVVLIDEPPAEDLWAEAISMRGCAAVTAGAADAAEMPLIWRLTAEILEKCLKDCYVFAVAHHRASLCGCDRVLVLSGGRKVGQ